MRSRRVAHDPRDASKLRIFTARQRTLEVAVVRIGSSAQYEPMRRIRYRALDRVSYYPKPERSYRRSGHHGNVKVAVSPSVARLLWRAERTQVARQRLIWIATSDAAAMRAMPAALDRLYGIRCRIDSDVQFLSSRDGVVISTTQVGHAGITPRNGLARSQPGEQVSQIP